MQQHLGSRKSIPKPKNPHHLGAALSAAKTVSEFDTNSAQMLQESDSPRLDGNDEKVPPKQHH